ncbi:MAG: helix-turn-helix transcriptional regulator [Planctomycetota bacterium]|jgi:predicted DNA-binding transcriptional regulator AlpA
MTLLTTQEVAVFLSKSICWVKTAQKHGIIPASVKVGGEHRWVKEHLEQWIYEGCRKNWKP